MLACKEQKKEGDQERQRQHIALALRTHTSR